MTTTKTNKTTMQKQEQCLADISAAMRTFKKGNTADIARDELKKASNLIPLLSICLETEGAKKRKEITSAEKKLAKLAEQTETEETKSEIYLTTVKKEKAEKRLAECVESVESLAKYNKPATQFSALWACGTCGTEYRYENREQVKALANSLQEILMDYPATMQTLVESCEYKGDVYKRIRDYMQEFFDLTGLKMDDDKPLYARGYDVSAFITGATSLRSKSDKNFNLTNSGYIVKDSAGIIQALCSVLCLKLDGKTTPRKETKTPVKAKQAATDIIK